MISLLNLGVEGRKRTVEAIGKFKTPTAYLNHLLPGLGDVVAEFWPGRDPVEGYAAGFISGMIYAERSGDPDPLESDDLPEDA